MTPSDPTLGLWLLGALGVIALAAAWCWPPRGELSDFEKRRRANRRDGNDGPTRRTRHRPF